MASDGDMADGDERTLFSGWGHGTWSAARVVVPEDQAGVERAIHSAERGLVARGLGRSYGDAAQNAGGTVAFSSKLNRFELFRRDSGPAVWAESGVSLRTLIDVLVPRGYFPPVLPGTADVTVGGAVAADIHGKNHHVDGGFGDYVESIEIVTVPSPNRPATKKISRDSDPELFRATVGGMGLTGFVLSAEISLTEIESRSMSVDTARLQDIDALMAAMEERDDEYRYSVAWLDCFAKSGRLGRGILSRANHSTVDGSDPSSPYSAPPSRVTLPEIFPGWLLRPSLVRAFNEAWFRRAPSEATGVTASISSYFHPLDSVRNWNRVYGRRGFVQYQFVVPFDQADVVTKVLERQAEMKMPAFLAVLKRMGPENDCYLSFPREGWTLALDFPLAYSRLSEMLDGFDELVAEAGGRIYLAKDCRARPETVAAMYPDLEKWREVRCRADPEGVFRSDLGRRVGLI